jgi:hypothetical protein
MMIFDRTKLFGLIDRGKRVVEDNATLGRNGDASNVVKLVISETSFRGLSILDRACLMCSK